MRIFLNGFYLGVLLLVSSCKASLPPSDEVRLDYNAQKEILTLKEFLLSYRQTNRCWPTEINPEITGIKNFKTLNSSISNDTLKVTFELHKIPTDSTKIKTLTGSFNFYFNNNTGFHFQDFPVRVEMEDGRILYDRYRIKNQ